MISSFTLCNSRTTSSKISCKAMRRSWVHRTGTLLTIPSVIEHFHTNLFHPVKLCVWFTSAADGSHSATQTDKLVEYKSGRAFLLNGWVLYHTFKDYVSLKGLFVPHNHNISVLEDERYPEIPAVTVVSSLLFRQHFPSPLLLSTDLDTSEDLSAELDRSHGFFTASGEGGEGINRIK